MEFPAFHTQVITLVMFWTIFLSNFLSDVGIDLRFLLAIVTLLFLCFLRGFSSIWCLSMALPLVEVFPCWTWRVSTHPSQTWTSMVVEGSTTGSWGSLEVKTLSFHQNLGKEGESYSFLGPGTEVTCTSCPWASLNASSSTIFNSRGPCGETLRWKQPTTPSQPCH